MTTSTDDAQIIANTLPFTCPTCKAQAGERCNVRRGDRVAHLARQDKHRWSVIRARRLAPWPPTPEELRETE